MASRLPDPPGGRQLGSINAPLRLPDRLQDHTVENNDAGVHEIIQSPMGSSGNASLDSFDEVHASLQSMNKSMNRLLRRSSDASITSDSSDDFDAQSEASSSPPNRNLNADYIRQSLQRFREARESSIIGDKLEEHPPTTFHFSPVQGHHDDAIIEDSRPVSQKCIDPVDFQSFGISTPVKPTDDGAKVQPISTGNVVVPRQRYTQLLAAEMIITQQRQPSVRHPLYNDANVSSLNQLRKDCETLKQLCSTPAPDPADPAEGQRIDEDNTSPIRPGLRYAHLRDNVTIDRERRRELYDAQPSPAKSVVLIQSPPRRARVSFDMEPHENPAVSPGPNLTSDADLVRPSVDLFPSVSRPTSEVHSGVIRNAEKHVEMLHAVVDLNAGTDEAIDHYEDRRTSHGSQDNVPNCRDSIESSRPPDSTRPPSSNCDSAPLVVIMSPQEATTDGFVGDYTKPKGTDGFVGDPKVRFGFDPNDPDDPSSSEHRSNDSESSIHDYYDHHQWNEDYEHWDDEYYGSGGDEHHDSSRGGNESAPPPPSPPPVWKSDGFVGYN